MEINSFTKYFPPLLTEKILLLGTRDLQEIRITAGKNCVILKSGILCDTNMKVTHAELCKIIDSMCRGSVYAMQTSLVKGYITLSGGHRVGVCGRTVTENGKITHLTDISSICIRISREVIGAADEVMEYLVCGTKAYNTLIISPPGCGKTTMLRDISRQLGNKFKVCIADERGEIAASKGGTSVHDVGKYTAVMDAVPKEKGIMMLLRTMSPDIIVTDETGREEEGEAISELINCGVKIITTAHGYSEKDVSKCKYPGKLVESGVFERVIVLSNRNGAGTVEKIISDGRVIRRV